MARNRYYVHILTNSRNTVLYFGMTNDINRRMREHRSGTGSGFSKRYRLWKLVYLEEFSEVRDAIYREKQLKNWRRQWKLNLIGEKNPDMNDLWADRKRAFG